MRSKTGCQSSLVDGQMWTTQAASLSQTRHYLHMQNGTEDPDIL